MQTVFQAVMIALCIAIPPLSLLAYRGWAIHCRRKLPWWHSALGATSILAIFFSWLSFASAILLAMLRLRIGFDTGVWLFISSLMLLIGILLAFALKGPSRAQTLFAGLLMILLLWATVNV